MKSIAKNIDTFNRALRGESPVEKKKGPRENIVRHESGLKKLEEEARQNQLRRRKMKRG